VRASRTVQIAAGLAIAAAGLWIFLRDVDLGQLGAELARGNPVVFIVCGALAVASIYFRSLRWRVMLPSPPGTHKRGLFGHVMISFMVNNIVPARAGEAARMLILWRKNGYPPAMSFGSVFIERYIDILLFMTFFIVPVFFLDRVAQLRGYALIGVGLFLLGLAPFVVYVCAPQFVKSNSGRVFRLFPGPIRSRAEKISGDVLANLDWIREPTKILVVAVLSVLTGISFALEIYILVGDFGVAGLLGGIFSQAYAVVGAAIPLSPGYVGTLHAMLLHGLTLLGHDREKACAIAILVHALSFVPITVIGLFFFFRLKIAFGEISDAKRTLKPRSGAGPVA
jgi:uncharacterized protein (TIRG00374 family)